MMISPYNDSVSFEGRGNHLSVYIQIGVQPADKLTNAPEIEYK
jgi:hypothetical protein